MHPCTPTTNALEKKLDYLGEMGTYSFFFKKNSPIGIAGNLCSKDCLVRHIRHALREVCSSRSGFALDFLRGFVQKLEKASPTGKIKTTPEPKKMNVQKVLQAARPLARAMPAQARSMAGEATGKRVPPYKYMRGVVSLSDPRHGLAFSGSELEIEKYMCRETVL